MSVTASGFGEIMILRLAVSVAGSSASSSFEACAKPLVRCSITAALFLQHFAGSVPWAHLDIASVGDSPEDSFEWTAGPTGFGARALLAWLGSPDPLEGI